MNNVDPNIHSRAVYVRYTSNTYQARIPTSGKAYTATCTAGAEQSAQRVVEKYFGQACAKSLVRDNTLDNGASIAFAFDPKTKPSMPTPTETNSDIPVRPEDIPAVNGQELVTIAFIEQDTSTQIRVNHSDEHIQDIADAYARKAPVPPVVLYCEKAEQKLKYWIADGWHRIAATTGLNWTKIPAIVHQGNRADAIRRALGANADHGLRRTNADKRNAVSIALKEFPKLSDRAIAEMCRVHHQMVGNLRPQVDDSSTCRIGKDGKEYPAAPEKSEKDKLDKEYEQLLFVWDADKPDSMFTRITQMARDPKTSWIHLDFAKRKRLCDELAELYRAIRDSLK